MEITNVGRKPYRVEVESIGCSTCHEGKFWIVAGPDGIGGGTLYGEKDEAEEIADLMSEAYDRGLEAGYEIRKEHEQLEQGEK